jgi:CRISPR-associated protein Cas5t
VVRLHVKGNFVSFRIQTGIRYHRTFYVPLKTTLIGLLGAALGREDSNLLALFNSVKTNAVLDTYFGTASDVWSVTKLKAHGAAETAPIVREMLFEPQYSIYYSANNSNDVSLDKIIDAFNDPVYALSLGRSDEMIEVKGKVEKIHLHSSSKGYFKNTILPFNYQNFFVKYDGMRLSKGQTFTLPQVMSIPTSFKLERGHIRKPVDYLQVTMVYDRGVEIQGRNDGWIDDKEQRNFFLY